MKKRGLLIALTALLICALALSVTVMADVVHNVTICVGETFALPADDTDNSYSTDNRSIVSSPSGFPSNVFVGHAVGSATVVRKFAQSSFTWASLCAGSKVYYTHYYKITVISGLEMEDLSIYVGSSAPMPLKINPFYEGKEAGTWKSSDDGVATVDKNGVVTGHSEGQAKISFKLSENDQTQSAWVTVQSKQEIPFLVFGGVAENSGTVDVPFTGGYEATGGTGMYTYTLPKAPDWLKVDAQTGALSGTPDAAGRYDFTITVTDSAGTSASIEGWVAVEWAELKLEAGSVNGSVGDELTGALAATGGDKGYTYEIVDKPDWLTFNEDGTFSGTSNTAGEFAYTVRVKDGQPKQAESTLTLIIADPALRFTGETEVLFQEADSALPIPVAVTGGTKPYDYTVTAYDDAVVAMDVLSKDDDDTGGWELMVRIVKPPLAEQTTVTVMVTDAKGNDATQTYTLVPKPPAQDEKADNAQPKAKKTKIKRIEEVEFGDE